MTCLVYSLSYEVKTALIEKNAQFASFHSVKSFTRRNGINGSTLVTNFGLKYTEFFNILPFTPFSLPKFLLNIKNGLNLPMSSIRRLFMVKTASKSRFQEDEC